MKRRTILGLSLFVASSAFAVEGMWQPEQLPLIEKDLKTKGLTLKPESLSSLTAFPMNAVVSLGGCSASFVSDTGLVVTNHHCAYGSIQFNSTPENNYLENGFYAKTLADEVPAAPGTRVFVTESIQDLTATLLKDLEKVDGLARYETIEKRKKTAIAECEKTPGYRCRIDPFLGESSYRLTKQVEIKDVRLVHAPPSAIGKFGGDIDNWMWPRHTGDFAFYRAYVSKDGKPVEFAKENVPYKPKGHLKVDSKGVDNGSFVMVAGYPGRTNRHRLASEVSFAFDKADLRTKDYFDRRIQIIDKFKAENKDLGLKYASTRASLANVSKNIGGKQEGYKAVNLLKEKQEGEADLLKSFASAKNSVGKSSYEDLNKLIKEDQEASDFTLALRKASESDLLRTAARLYRLAREKEKPDAERESGYQERDQIMFRESLKTLSKRFDPKVDQAFWELGLSDVRKVDKKIQAKLPKAILEIVKLDSKKTPAKLADFYKNTVLQDEKKRLELMDANRKTLEALNDPYMKLAVATYDDTIKIENAEKDRSGRFQKARSAYMQNMVAQRQKEGKVIYPDANSTLRITYGTIQGYKNRKGTPYTAFTKLEEIAGKNTGKEPFNVPAKQLDLIKKKDYGTYKLDSIGTVPVNFLADLDITGGNSGSATLNAKGELTGLVFDGTIDGLISDWYFDPAYTRSIHVDTRYMLWVLDKYDNATRLLKEMGVTPSSTTPSH